MSSIKFDSIKFFVSCGFIIHVKNTQFCADAETKDCSGKQETAPENRLDKRIK